MKISVIVIAYNEEATIGKCIASLQKATHANQVEMVAADGGSTDRTRTIAADLGLRVIRSDKGRGNQCRRGAASVSGDILVFLHSDSLFPDNGFAVIRQYFKNPWIQAATFRMRFDAPHPLLKIYSFFTRFDSILSSFGDQGIVVRKELYHRIGGFPAWLLFEDVHFLRQARKKTKIISLPAAIITSSRRFLAGGMIRQQVANLFYILRYLLGVPGDVLAARYQRHGIKLPPAAAAVMAKYPVAGEVKTRLAGTIGEKQACLCYRLCAEQCLKQVKKTAHIKPFVFHAGSQSEEKMAAWTGPGFELVAQQGNSLGERLNQAFQYLFSRGFKKVVIVGSDVPDINPEMISDALAILDLNDIVLGPARDGGYFLIGMKTHLPRVFENIDWSTDRVLAQTLATIEQSHLSWALLPELMDIDTEADLKLWCSQAAAKHPLYRKFWKILNKRG